MRSVSVSVAAFFALGFILFDVTDSSGGSETYDEPAGGGSTMNDTGDQKIVANTIKSKTAADILSRYLVRRLAACYTLVISCLTVVFLSKCFLTKVTYYFKLAFVLCSI